jgi:hypothetical protein
MIEVKDYQFYGFDYVTLLTVFVLLWYIIYIILNHNLLLLLSL